MESCWVIMLLRGGGGLDESMALKVGPGSAIFFTSDNEQSLLLKWGLCLKVAILLAWKNFESDATWIYEKYGREATLFLFMLMNLIYFNRQTKVVVGCRNAPAGITGEFHLLFLFATDFVLWNSA
jgi:hypothetical protein